MSVKVIFNLLIAIFGVLTIAGFIIGINSVINYWFLEHSEKLARIGMWLFFGCGIAFLICVAVRITLGIVK